VAALSGVPFVPRTLFLVINGEQGQYPILSLKLNNLSVIMAYNTLTLLMIISASILGE